MTEIEHYPDCDAPTYGDSVACDCMMRRQFDQPKRAPASVARIARLPLTPEPVVDSVIQYGGRRYRVLTAKPILSRYRKPNQDTTVEGWSVVLQEVAEP